MAKTVAIIGAGPSGLVTLKECLAQGLDATIFEAQGHIGGQWQYVEPDEKTGLGIQSSMYKGAVFNSCRDTSHFSDFPMDPSIYPEYTPQWSYIKYLHEYSDYFELMPHITLNTKVVKCTPAAEDKWEVTIEKVGEEVTQTFDALLVCVGLNTDPLIPEFEGMKDFKGQFMHSHVYRTPGPFEHQKVALIGMGSTSVDISCELAPGSDETHVVVRNPGYVLPRFILGKPVEAFDNRLAFYLPSWFSEWIQALLYNFLIGKLPESIQPKHGLLGANPNMRGDFIEKVTLGNIRVHRTTVEKFTETGLLLSNGEKLDVDVIIAATGYLVDFPFLPKDSWHAKDSLYVQSPNSINLYENMVPLDYKNLFFIGVAQLFGPVTSIAEIQARYAAAAIAGRFQLPSREVMAKWIEKYQLSLKKYPKDDRHTMTIPNLVRYADELLRPLKANPTLGRLLKKVFTSNPIKAFGVLNAVYMNLVSPAQFRLFGDGAKPELASETLLRANKNKKTLSPREVQLMETGKSEELMRRELAKAAALQMV